ncbi:MAG: Fe-S cluster assembly sulfur transfer protein SufU [Acidobacteriota bacterium]
MPELRELYHQVIIDHGKRPRNFHKMPGATHHAEGFNPLCGDRVDLYLMIVDGTIRDISFEGVGCAISTAATSMMTGAVKGRTIDEARRLFDSFHCMVTGNETATAADAAGLGKLSVFSGVREYPARIKCAILGWHTMISALEGKHALATTE